MKRNPYSQTSKTFYLSIIALLLAAVSFTSCSKKSDPAGTAYIEFVNASETSSPIDFYVGTTKTNSAPLTYNQSVSYFPVSSVQQSALIKIPSSGQTAASFYITPQANAYWSIYYFDGTTVAYPDDVTAPQTGKARVRFINLNSGLTANVDFGITGGATVISNLISKLNSDYIEVNPAATFSLYLTGTTTELLNIPTTIQAGHIYTIYLSGATQSSLVATVLLQK